MCYAAQQQVNIRWSDHYKKLVFYFLHVWEQTLLTLLCTKLIAAISENIPSGRNGVALVTWSLSLHSFHDVCQWWGDFNNLKDAKEKSMLKLK